MARKLLRRYFFHVSIPIVIAFLFFLIFKIYFMYLFLFCFNFIVVQVQFFAFPPLHSSLPQPPSLDPNPVGFAHVSFIVVPENPSPFTHIIPSHLPLVPVSLFFISVFLVIFCLLTCFVDLVPLKGEIIQYLSFTTWLISLSIMLSSPICAVTKV